MSALDVLQIALVDHLRSDPQVSAYLAGRIWDNAPSDAAYPYATLGPSEETDDSADCIAGYECIQQVDVWVQEGGAALPAKVICGAVKRSLHGADIALSGGFALSLISVDRVRVIGDPDDQIAHGVLTVRAQIEGG